MTSFVQLLKSQQCFWLVKIRYSSPTIPSSIEMDNPGEVSQILSGITFDRNNIFLMREKATYSPQNYMHVAFVRIKKYCSYQKLCHF